MVDPKRNDLVYPELSYQIVGALFTVYNKLGSGYQEKYYQKAVGSELRSLGLLYKEQVRLPLSYNQESLGSYYLDFLIDNKIVLELKKDERFSRRNIEQVYAYLKASNLKLGIIANFGKKELQFKRILNIS